MIGTEEIVQFGDILEIEAVDRAVAEQASRDDGRHLFRVRSGVRYGHVILKELADQLYREGTEPNPERDFAQDALFILEAPADIEIDWQGLRCLAQRHDIELREVRHDVERMADGHGIALEEVVECRAGLLAAEELKLAQDDILHAAAQLVARGQRSHVVEHHDPARMQMAEEDHVLGIGINPVGIWQIDALIREEIAAGKSVIAAIEIGFKKALSAIVDGNVTTLIAAAVLGVLGSGTVKGFAITLALGVVLSMFTALVITRILMNALYAVGLRDQKFYGKAKAMKNINFMSKKAVFFACSILVICVGFVGMGVHGAKGDKALNYSLEFLGGTSTTVEFNEAYTLAQADDEIVPKIAEVIGNNDVQTQVVDNTNQIIFKTRSLDLEQREALNTMLENDYGVDESAITSSNIGSTISGEMRSQSVIAVIVAAFFMLLYIWFRFKDIRFASSAIIALIHDVLVVLALYAVARISVGSAFIACMLTVIGYSVNDTIVIFDRIRENKKVLRDETPESLQTLANESITQTLSRSISTSFTTVVMVLMLLILGVTSIREFALPLLVGIVCGTYSSICIATELWYVMKVHIKGKKKAN